MAGGQCARSRILDRYLRAENAWGAAPIAFARARYLSSALERKHERPRAFSAQTAYIYMAVTMPETAFLKEYLGTFQQGADFLSGRTTGNLLYCTFAESKQCQKALGLSCLYM